MLPEKNSKSKSKSKCGKKSRFYLPQSFDIISRNLSTCNAVSIFCHTLCLHPTFRFNRCVHNECNRLWRIFLFFVKMVIKMVQVFSRGQTRIFFAVVISPWIQNEASSISDTLAGISSCINSTSTKITRKFRRQHWYAMRFQRTSLQIRVMH